MEELIRTRVSSFTLEDSLTLSEVEEKKKRGELSDIVIPIDRMFEMYETVSLQPEYEFLVYNGNPFPTKYLSKEVSLTDGMKVRVYDGTGQFLAIYQYMEENHIFKIEKMFFER